MPRKLLCVFLALLMLLGCIGGAFALESEQPHPNQAEIDRVVELGLFTVGDDGEFLADAPMTRAMFAAVLGRLADIVPEDWPVDYLPRIFSDVDVEAYYAPYLSWALHNGILSGVGDGRFCPDEPILREQIAYAIARWLLIDGIELYEGLPAGRVSLEPMEPVEVAPTGPTEPLTSPQTLTVIDPDAPTAAESEASEPAAEAETSEEPETHSSGLWARYHDTGLSDIKRQLIRGEAPTMETDALLMGYFTDADEISDWARAGVSLLVSKQVMSGIDNPEGGCRFAPQEELTRAEAAVLFCRLLDRMHRSDDALQEPLSLVLNVSYLSLEAGRTANLVATVFPFNVSNSTVVWYSEDSEIASVDQRGYITALAGGETTVCAVSSNLLVQSCVIEVTAAPEPEPEPEPETVPETEPAPAPTEAPEPAPAPETETVPETVPDTVPEEITGSIETPTAAGLGSITMSDYEKDLLIFGQEVADPRLFYASDADALAQQVVIVVKTWDLAGDGTKYTRTWNLQIHRNIAPTAQAIFDEIYALPEMPVIHSLGGWRANAGKSEHKPGLAIDINWLENYYCDPNGKAITGYYFRPGEDPYSIPIGGSVDQIFNKYGFIRGIYWRTGYRDYMHYSFYGT